MKTYIRTELSDERELEHLVRTHTRLIEEGLIFVDHQRPAAGGRLDVLLMDRNKALAVAELKAREDDEMLFQGLDYDDDVLNHIEAYARLYKPHAIDPTKEVRLILIAPSFSFALINRCKWLNVPITLFTFNCLKFEGENEVLPVFTEFELPTIPAPTKVVSLEGDVLAYITDTTVRSRVKMLLEEIAGWKPGITLDPISRAISLKVNNRVFAYLTPRRKYYIIGTPDEVEDKWNSYPIKSDDDLAAVRRIMLASIERQIKQ